MKVENKTLKLFISSKWGVQTTAHKKSRVCTDWKQDLQLCPMENCVHGNKHLRFHPVSPYSHCRFLLFSFLGSLCAKEDLGEPLVCEFGFGKLHKKGPEDQLSFPMRKNFSLLYHSQLPSSIWRKQWDKRWDWDLNWFREKGRSPLHQTKLIQGSLEWPNAHPRVPHGSTALVKAD